MFEWSALKSHRTGSIRLRHPKSGGQQRHQSDSGSVSVELQSLPDLHVSGCQQRRRFLRPCVFGSVLATEARSSCSAERAVGASNAPLSALATAIALSSSAPATALESSAFAAAVALTDRLRRCRPWGSSAFAAAIALTEPPSPPPFPAFSLAAEPP